MDFQFKGEAGEKESVNSENEYHLEIKIDSLALTKHDADDIKLIFIFGDLVNKMMAERGAGFDGRSQAYIVHSVPEALSEKLLNIPMMLNVISIQDLKPLGSMLLEVNECFANAIKCADFRSESIKKVYELDDGKENLGQITFHFNVSKDIGNSNRHRRFYTESTQEKAKMMMQST